MRKEAGHNIVDVTFPKAKMKAFWKKVNKNTPSGCWQWKGAAASDGYARFRINAAKSAGAARISWVLENRTALPSWHRLQRTCSNRLCVNPLHVRRIECDLHHPDVGKRKRRAWVLHPPGNATILSLSDALHPDNDASSIQFQENISKLLDELQEVKNANRELITSIRQLISAQKSRISRLEEQVSGLSEAGTRILNIETSFQVFSATYLEKMKAADQRQQAADQRQQLFENRMGLSINKFQEQQESRAEKLEEKITRLLSQPQPLTHQDIMPQEPHTPAEPASADEQPRAAAQDEEQPSVTAKRDPFYAKLAEVLKQSTSCDIASSEDWDGIEAAFSLLQATNEDAVDAFFHQVQKYADSLGEYGGMPTVSGFLQMVEESVRFRTDEGPDPLQEQDPLQEKM